MLWKLFWYSNKKWKYYSKKKYLFLRAISYIEKSKNKDNQTSSYKIFSRAACNFVFPKGKEFERPIPEKNKYGDYEEADLDDVIAEDGVNLLGLQYEESS